jgi:predicted naringenin-chalcone synthase
VNVARDPSLDTHVAYYTGPPVLEKNDRYMKLETHSMPISRDKILISGKLSVTAVLYIVQCVRKAVERRLATSFAAFAVKNCRL